MICSACEEYAALSSSDPKQPLCGNCALLSPDKLKGVISARLAQVKIDAGMKPGVIISELKHENEQLKADVEALQSKNAALTEANIKLSQRLNPGK